MVGVLIADSDYQPPKDVEFSGFRNAVKNALAKSKDSDVVQVLTKESTSLDCHLPPSSIMLTLTNFYTLELFALQHKGLEVWNLKECLESRFVSVCLDEKCMKVCEAASINNCFLLPIETMASDYNENSFRYLMYLKHLLMYESLKVVDEVMFFDVDVIIFRNPWVDTLHRRYDNGNVDLSSVRPDLMWQPEWKYNMSCSGTPNGGQLFMRNSTKVQNFYKSFFGMKTELLDKEGRVDQDIMEEFAVNASMSTCSLPYWKFAAWNMATNAPFDHGARMMDLVSFHTSGVRGVKAKAETMANIYKGLEMKDPSQLVWKWL